jgi:tight adherence protein B
MLVLIIAILFAISVAGFIYAMLQALRIGAENYASIYSVKAAQGFADIFFFIPPQRITELAGCAAVLFFISAFLIFGSFENTTRIIQGMLFGAAAALFALNLPKLMLSFYKKRRLERFNNQLVEALGTMSAVLKAGGSVSQAFEHIAKQQLSPISQEFALVMQEVRVGVKFNEALENMNKRISSEDLTLMIRAIEIARQTGGNLTDVLDRIATTIYERNRINMRIKALTSQGKTQGIVVGLMPVALAFLLYFLNPALIISFFTSPIGILIILLVIVLETIGAILIKKIVTIDV